MIIYNIILNNKERESKVTKNNSKEQKLFIPTENNGNHYRG